MKPQSEGETDKDSQLTRMRQGGHQEKAGGSSRAALADDPVRPELNKIQKRNQDKHRGAVPS